MITRSHDKLKLLLKEAHAAYKSEVENRINIRSSYDQYVHQSNTLNTNPHLITDILVGVQQYPDPNDPYQASSSLQASNTVSYPTPEISSPPKNGMQTAVYPGVAVISSTDHPVAVKLP
jgi:hypothetical protein